MEKIAIVCDSCGDIDQSYLDQYDIKILPMLIVEGETTYRDGIDIDVDMIYEKQKQDVVLKTSLPSGQSITDLFDRLQNEGYTHVIVFTLSSALSGTYNQIRLLSSMYEQMKIKVFDSKSGSIAYGCNAIITAEWVKQGMSFDSICEKAQYLIDHSYGYFSVDDLIHLYKGGRCSAASAFVGTLIKIKPILSFNRENGELMIPAKVRGSKKAYAKLIEFIEQDIQNHQGDFVLLVADGGEAEKKMQLKNDLQTKFPQAKGIIEAKIGSTLSVYLGSGMLGAGVVFLN